MNADLRELHIKVGMMIGENKTCGNKINYGTEESAIKAAEGMNKKQNTRNTLEAYPCGFCDGWHIGREMNRSELESYLQ